MNYYGDCTVSKGRVLIWYFPEAKREEREGSGGAEGVDRERERETTVSLKLQKKITNLKLCSSTLHHLRRGIKRGFTYR